MSAILVAFLRLIMDDLDDESSEDVKNRVLAIGLYISVRRRKVHSNS